MFERYTERARRVIFFGRVEASRYGGVSIGTEHLLLGLVREDRNIANRFLPESVVSAESIRTEIEKRITIRDKVSTSAELPLSDECKRILAYAADEAPQLKHHHIGTEHLLLGIMREESCMAAQILRHFGLRARGVRDELARSLMAVDAKESSYDLRPSLTASHNPALPAGGIVPDAATAQRIAEAVWIPLYGAETIKTQMPLTSELKYGVWLVTGAAGPQELEGQLFAYILQTDGRILPLAVAIPAASQYLDLRDRRQSCFALYHKIHRCILW